mmetsp:Transcript_39760/g.90139  ORF Transcript_39760/g.90139 Transcript_39760/m.90139 type:complete len:376 (-) Transcript_39760:138-1265(-)|eukprot:CAMPEP_0181217296 /NCGR_PEP_ID=MMETSP1096-20121128/27071_1 /TAXON_ID=156174 ORGANISM="Chrysochromulina ericina, Strain CCMP281" /NCGR_SAMPLE_ID=MMETSP1096 /ASSEMBLY_ACC=CAM_ASM_000453 /LENGTH=375 /DNA_ID=CAMNT_0023309409 /DNA_START=81 /DNA_END=1208 /DNA_ORIENTATION=+
MKMDKLKAKQLLLLVLRGEVMRFGPQNSRQTFSSLQPQLRALASLQRNAIAHAWSLGWETRCLAHVSYTARVGASMNARRLLHHLQTLFMVDAVEMLPAAKQAPSQLMSIVRTLKWVSLTASKFRWTHLWRAMLLVRADLEFKAPLPLPPAGRAGCEVLAPFQVGQDAPSDVLWFLPRCRYREFAQVVTRMATDQWQLGLTGSNRSKCPPSYFTCDDLHSVCKIQGGLQGVSYFLPTQHDADSFKMQNPLYRMIGRPEATRRAVDYYRGHIIQGAPCRPFESSCRTFCSAPSLQGPARLPPHVTRAWGCRNDSLGVRAAQRATCCNCNRPTIVLGKTDALYSGVAELSQPTAAVAGLVCAGLVCTFGQHRLPPYD